MDTTEPMEEMMGQQEWREAAARYVAFRIANAAKEPIAPEGVAALEEIRARRRRREQGVVDVGKQLDAFMASEEGEAALELLRASARRILFGKEEEGGNSVLYFFDKDGMKVSYAAGEQIGNGALDTSPKLKVITGQEAAAAAIYLTGKDPDTVMPWLREVLDDIAKRI